MGFAIATFEQHPQPPNGLARWHAKVSARYEFDLPFVAAKRGHCTRRERRIKIALARWLILERIAHIGGTRSRPQENVTRFSEQPGSPAVFHLGNIKNQRHLGIGGWERGNGCNGLTECQLSNKCREKKQ